MYLISVTLFITTAICGLLYFFLSVWKSMTYWKVRGVKHQPPWPIVGNLGALLRLDKHITYFYNKIYNAFPDERMVGLYEFMTPTLVVRDPELIEQVLVRDFLTFPDHGPFLIEDDSIISDSVFALLGSGVKWRAVRNKLLTTFSTGKMKAIFPELVATCQSIVDRNPKMLIKDDFTVFAIESFLNGMFGTAILPAGREELIHYCKAVFEGRGSRMFQQHALTYFPKLSQFFNMTFISNEQHNYFSSLMLTLIKQRGEVDCGRNDYAQVLVDMKRQDKMTIFSKVNNRESEVFDITDELVISQAFMFFFAGLDTTTLVMLHLAFHLSLEKKCQETARQEVRSVLKKYGGYSWESVRDMKYLDACIQETLRIHPSLPFVVRVNNKPTNIGGVNIDKGTRILIASESIQMDPKNYPDPEKFDPGRWLDENRPPRKYTHLPFSDGPRVCLGKRFALMEIGTLFAHILDNFELSLNPETKVPLIYEPNVIFHSPSQQNPVRIDVTKIC
ncbi:cytochrome P450 6k1 [Halyomorpha halys]|uniref:cytochrome P450 6k1 n=1 Tax=Halyomorpha halys TaxID=286706 RepID=UPI0006D4D2A0|nr:cytochrome P450 6k1 [Halyomorpha halys]